MPRQAKQTRDNYVKKRETLSQIEQSTLEPSTIVSPEQ